MAGNTSEPGVGQVERIARVLDVFDHGHRRLSFSEIVARSGLPKATCHRMLAGLVLHGFLQTDTAGRYEIGSAMWEWGLLAPVEGDLRRVALPYMQDLLAATRQVVNLFVLDEGHAMLLERISGSSVGAPLAAPGERLPLLRSAAGKVLLAQSTNSTDDAVRIGMAADPEAAVSEVAARDELDRVRRQGWAMSSQSMHTGAWGLAVPIPLPKTLPPAAVGIVALAPIRDPQRVMPALMVTAAAIARAVERHALRD